MPYLTKFNRNDYAYTPLFCEENIWKLVESLYTNQFAKPIDVLFIVNQADSVAVFEQNQSLGSNPVIWDYHVLLLAQINNELVVFDFDSRCEFPTPVTKYFNVTFPSTKELYENFQPYIKIINANYYYQHFYSDRKHMLGLIDSDKFPDYEIIQPKNGLEKLSLSQCREMLLTNDDSEIMSPDDYLKYTKSK